jgi:hypothetical protein
MKYGPCFRLGEKKGLLIFVSRKRESLFLEDLPPNTGGNGIGKLKSVNGIDNLDSGFGVFAKTAKNIARMILLHCGLRSAPIYPELVRGLRNG